PVCRNSYCLPNSSQFLSVNRKLEQQSVRAWQQLIYFIATVRFNNDLLICNFYTLIIENFRAYRIHAVEDGAYAFLNVSFHEKLSADLTDRRNRLPPARRAYFCSLLEVYKYSLTIHLYWGGYFYGISPI